MPPLTLPENAWIGAVTARSLLLLLLLLILCCGALTMCAARPSSQPEELARNQIGYTTQTDQRSYLDDVADVLLRPLRLEDFRLTKLLRKSAGVNAGQSREQMSGSEVANSNDSQ